MTTEQIIEYGDDQAVTEPRTETTDPDPEPTPDPDDFSTVTVDRSTLCLVIGAATAALWISERSEPAPILVDAIRTLGTAAGIDIDRYLGKPAPAAE